MHDHTYVPAITVTGKFIRTHTYRSGKIASKSPLKIWIEPNPFEMLDKYLETPIGSEEAISVLSKLRSN